MDGADADLKEGVTDSGLRALAAAGCGIQLTSLSLDGELLSVPNFLVCSLCVVCHYTSDCRCYMALWFGCRFFSWFLLLFLFI